MSKFTKGPWKVNGSDQSTAIWVEDADGKRVCTVRNCDTDLDRARLIAAAPEMLAVCQFLINWNDDGGFPGERRAKLIEAARAILAKVDA